MDEAMDLLLNVRGDDLTDDDLARITSGLRRQLLELDVRDVRPASAGELPPGARSGTAIAFGALVVSVAPALVAGVVEVVSSWLSRQPRQIEVEIAGQRFSGTVTAAQQRALVDAYLAGVRDERPS